MPGPLFDVDAFLRDYWQKQPILILNPWGREPWNGWQNPLEPDELAGLSGEEGVESRLIEHKRSGWALAHGPFAAARFGKLGKVPWTLLVNAVDHHVPQVAALIEPFRFVPNWRIDDVMVSYASDGGGTGPHFDQYDVFLIQGLGRRRWQVGALCDGTTALLPHDDLRLLADFVPTDEWLLEPGDILYVPPRVAHNGVAVGDDCMTYSVGFRAPSQAELIEGWCEDLIDGMTDDARYADADLRAQDNPGEIGAAALARLHAMVTAPLQDRAAFARWFGRYSSAPKYPEMDWRPETPIGLETVRALIEEGVPLVRNPASRFAFVRQDAGLLLFVDGACFDCAPDLVDLAERLCAQDHVALAPAMVQLSPAMDLVASLLDQGSIAFEDEREEDEPC